MARRKKPKQTLDMEPSSSILRYLHKILTFLTSDDKSQVFPSLTMQMEDILVRITKGTEFLKQWTFDDDCKSIVDEISAVLEENKHAFTLSYGFENDELGKKVMVYKKISPVHIFKEPGVFKPLRRPNVIQASKSNSNPSLLMSRFKTNTLNATLKFVKNDAQLILQYPDMTTEQADLVKKMITQCKAPQEINESGFRNLYDPLTEALKIFSLKYHFELNAETHGDMKRLKFEKILKSTEGKIDLDSSISSISSDGSIPLSKKILKNVQYLTEAMAKLDRAFIDSSINRLKDFLKDSTREDLLFSDLNKHQKLFLTEWKTILKRVEVIKMFDLKGQMILDEIRDSVDRGADCGKFRVQVTTEVISSNVRSVTFSKTPLNVPVSRAAKAIAPAPLANVKTAPSNVPTKSAHMPEDIPSGSSVSSCSSQDESAGSVAYNKKIERFIKKIKTLPQTWIKATLTELKSFIQDESQASLIIPAIKNPQMVYLTKLPKMLSNTALVEAYQPDVQVILWAIHRAMFVNALKFKLSFKMTSVRKGKVRDITFIKTPCFPSLQMKAKQTNLKENVNKTPATPKTSLQDTSSPPTAAPVLSKTPSATSLTLPAAKSRAVTKKKRPKSATGTSRRTVAKKLPPAKVKLIEGLNQPVVSEKGIKMMRSMGWDGGALGLRGEGITEPIRLQLDMGSRAGLGSVKPPSRQPAAPVTTNLPLHITRVVVPYMPDKKEFKKGILQTILKMLTEEQTATEVCFPNALTLKNWRFIKHHVTVLSNRERISADATPLNELCHSILDIMKETEYVITACWGTSKTNVLIIIKNIYQPTDIDSNDWCSVANPDNASVRAKELTNPGVSINDSGTVMLDGEPFRCYVLAQILDFCQQSKIVIDKGPSKGTIEKNLPLKGTMARKQMAFIEDLIIRLNRKSRSSSNSVHESSLFDEIKALIEGFTLKVDFPTLKDADASISPVHKIIRLQKIFDVQKTDQNLKNIPATDKGTIGKIEIRSVESITDFTKKYKKDGTTKTIANFQNYIEFVSKNAQNKTIDTKNLDQKIPENDCQNTQEHYFDANDTNNCLCCLPDYDDDDDDERENKIIEKGIAEYICIENESFYPIADIGRPIVVDDKPKDRPINNERDKENDRSLLTEGVMENDRPIVAENDKDMSLVTDSDKEKDIPRVPNSDKENDMIILTDRENDMPIVSDCDKENDWPIVIEDDKENYIPIVTKSYIEYMSQKHADILNTSTETVDENILCLIRTNYNKHQKSDSADDQTKRELLKEIEFVKQIESASKAQRVDGIELNQECLDKNEGSQTCKENQIISKTDKDLGKRRSNGQTPERLRKKCRYADFVKHISITPKDYPQSKITNKMAGEIQKSILQSIDYTQVLPLLKCHGIQDGALSYSCYSEDSLNLIENVMKSLDFQVTVKQERNITRIKMAFRLNTYLDESIDTLLKRLKIYNVILNTKEWVVIKKEQCSDYVVIQVEMDYNSFKFIRDERFTLYAGLDMAKFSNVWD